MRLLPLALIPIAGLAGRLAADELPITAGDRLMVTVSDEQELTGTFTVDQEGNIVLPLIDKTPAAGKSLSELREDLKKRLSRVIREPQVRVEFQERAQINIGFTGFVKNPGPMKLKKGSRLLDGVAQASGLVLPEADETHVRLQRRGEKTPRILDLRNLTKDAALNLELQDGDQIDVPPVPMTTIHVLGAVNKPGEFVRKERVSLLDALGLAGGLGEEANRREVQILRKGAPQPETIALEDVLTGKLTPTLQDGDTLTVPAVHRIAVKVFGHVAKPGEHEVKDGTTVLDAVTESGGFAPDADRAAVLVTPLSGEFRTVNLVKVDGPDGSLRLEDGTKIYVPEQAPLRYAVSGGVTEPGLFPMPRDGSHIYLSDALAQAKGPIDRAKKKTIALVRKKPSGEPDIRRINYDAYLRGKDPSANPEILANDVIYVDAEPDKERKPSVLERVLGLAARFVF